jgi:hypothetical protein
MDLEYKTKAQADIVISWGPVFDAICFAAILGVITPVSGMPHNVREF